MADVPLTAPTFDPAMSPETYANPLVNALIRGAAKLAMIPGQAYQSQTPITTGQMIKPAADLAMGVTLGAGAAPAEANTLRAGILSVARKKPNGEMVIGKPGDIHSDLMTRSELNAEKDSPEVAASMGYATPEGNFLTRDEALQFAMKNEPQRAAWSAQQPEFGLDAATYHNDPKGIRAYHGSPHDFDAFDLSKIGTGEGAQAYGHGLYFAENEGTAKAYRDALGVDNYSTPSDIAAAYVRDFGKDAPAKMKEHILEPVAGSGMGGQSLREAYQLLKEKPDIKPAPPPGHMYQVDINADPEHFLDWDKPLSEQPQAVKDALGLRMTEQLGPSGYLMKSDKLGGWHDPEQSGGAFYQKATQRLGGQRPLAGGAYSVPYANEPAATAALRDAGIPGIKYLDQGSRSAGEGSRNYVVFNDKLVDILKKYALAGAVPATGVVAGAGANTNASQVPLSAPQF